MKRTVDLVPRVLIAMGLAAVVVLLSMALDRSTGTNRAALAAGQAASSEPVVIVQRVEAAPREEVIDLPEDGQEYHLSIFVHDDWRKRSQERSLVAWFEAETRLKSVKAASLYHLYTSANPLYAARFKATVPTLPAVMIQDATGKVHYKASGENLPTSALECGDQVEKIFKNRPYYIFSWRKPPPCPPQPEPVPDVTPMPPDEEVPDTEVNVVLAQIAADKAEREAAEKAKAEEAAMAAKQEDGDPWWIMAVAVVVAGVGTVVYSIRKEAGGR
ncbi:MAG TPA: hypothetical protein VMY37_20520 [Thermoguttaceae bacterium]|nr:hypothetical protein [Thermoguttaceae bacterium]